MGRWLTDADKARVLDGWYDRIEHAPRTGPDHPGGHGGVDTPMIEVCAEINALAGVVTLQSCEGHVLISETGRQVYSGQLWLWLDRANAGTAYKMLPAIAKVRGFEQPRIMWQADGQEVLDLRWNSVELSPKDAGRRVLGWLASVTSLAPLLAAEQRDDGLRVAVEALADELEHHALAVGQRENNDQWDDGWRAAHQKAQHRLRALLAADTPTAHPAGDAGAGA